MAAITDEKVWRNLLAVVSLAAQFPNGGQSKPLADHLVGSVCVIPRRLGGDHAEIRHIEDPLFGTKTDERYAALVRQIARQSKGSSAITCKPASVVVTVRSRNS